ncbi:MAG: hypothetical protein D6732_01800, partial [Methanobacteriota archaeon]
MNDAVHGSEWTEYLDKLYEWVNSRLTAYQNGEISKEEYYRDYDYYKMEIKRVYAIIEERKRKKKNQQPIQSQVIKPDLIFKYFYENEPNTKSETSLPSQQETTDVSQMQEVQTADVPQIQESQTADVPQIQESQTADV